jgi:hypothetical protein
LFPFFLALLGARTAGRAEGQCVQGFRLHRVPMKTVFPLAALWASFALLGCTQTRPPGSLAQAESRVDPSVVGNADSPPGTYGKRETYAHASSDVSATALIAGGSTASGPPVAPDPTVIEARLQEWRLSPADIAAELDSGRPIVRTKGTGADAPGKPIADEELLTMVNNRLVADVDTVRIDKRLTASHGEVTMRGAAGSAGLVGRAIAIALDTKGVTKVTSELRIDPRLPPALRDDPSRIETSPIK